MTRPTLLLDTNALLWLLAGDDRLGVEARAVVTVAEEISVSVASLWEIAIKVSIGKLAGVTGLSTTLHDLGIRRLSIEDAHLDALQSLPLLHRDPFDRMLITQAQVEGMAVLTADVAFADYQVEVVDASA